MQTTIAVHCGRRDRTSLRDAIVNDAKLEAYGLAVKRQQKPGRNPGWAKLVLLEPGEHGVLNIVWDGSARLLVARAITRANRPPSLLIGRFVEFLLARYPRRVRSIVLSP